jgi:hypothetical protein
MNLKGWRMLDLPDDPTHESALAAHQSGFFYFQEVMMRRFTGLRKPPRLAAPLRPSNASP